MRFAIDLGFDFGGLGDGFLDSGLSFLALGFMALLYSGLLFFVLIVLYKLYLGTLKRTFDACSPENCEMNSPHLVWLNLIPIFNLYWIFLTVIKLANSVKKEYAALGISRECSGGYTVGLAYPICFSVSLIFSLFSLELAYGVIAVGFVCWIIHWFQVGKFLGIIKKRKQSWMLPPPVSPTNGQGTRMYIHKDGKLYGPYPIELLRKYVQQGNFTTEDLACHDGQNWVTVAEVPGFAPPSPQPPFDDVCRALV
ncbi:MAG: hypothetical protein CMI31_08900 [Opitutae bacterium]|nr:hypothetical protein [Opitutae bacterium]|tara:strand:- start:5500 stop:6258 length:759 start_codon:yes stop_codon:yes gene_type:complete